MLRPFANAILNRIAGNTAKRSTGCAGNLGMVALCALLGFDAFHRASWWSNRNNSQTLDDCLAIAPFRIAAPITDFHRIRVPLSGFDRHQRSGIIGSMHLFTPSMPLAT